MKIPGAPGHGAMANPGEVHLGFKLIFKGENPLGR